MRRVCVGIAALLTLGFCLEARAANLGQDMVECKIELPNGTVYMKGATDPVAKLVVKLTLTNKTTIEKKTKEEVEVRDAEWLSEEDIAKMRTMLKDEERQAFVKSKTKSKTVKLAPVNKNSIGYAYVPPQLGTHELIEMVVKKLPDEGEKGEGDEGPKPVRIKRDMAIEYTHPQDRVPTKYLPAGETSPAYTLEIGKYAKITKPGRYTVKLILLSIPDSSTPSGRVESNEEQFQVLPYKIVTRKQRCLKKWIAAFERGHPDFDYMFYQLPVAAPYQEIYYVQRLHARGNEHWEWHRLCSLAPDSKAQVKQVTPKKVAILAKHYKGDAGLYVVDFSRVDPAITTKILDIKGGELPKLQVEGGQVTAE